MPLFEDQAHTRRLVRLASAVLAVVVASLMASACDPPAAPPGMASETPAPFLEGGPMASLQADDLATELDRRLFEEARFGETPSPGYTAAKMRLKDALQSEPSNVELLVLHGWLLANEADFTLRGTEVIAQARQESQRAFEQALELDPDHDKALTGLADVLFMMALAGEDEALNAARAMDLYQRVLEIWPDDLEIRVRLAETHMLVGDLAEAERLLASVLAEGQGDAGNESTLIAKEVIARLALLQGDHERAEASFLEAAALLDQLGDDAPPMFGCPYEGLGLLYLTQGRDEEAKAYLERAARANPGFESEKLFGLATILRREGRPSEACKLLYRAQELEPGNREVAQELAGCAAPPEEGPAEF